jgi:hypothetical protein
MKMKSDNLFPLVEPREGFKEKLKLEMVQQYNQSKQPLINWRWLLGSSAAVLSLLLVLSLSSPTPTIINKDFSQQTERNIEGQAEQVEISEVGAGFIELENEIDTVAQTLDDDVDLDSAISFANL